MFFFPLCTHDAWFAALERVNAPPYGRHELRWCARRVLAASQLPLERVDWLVLAVASITPTDGGDALAVGFDPTGWLYMSLSRSLVAAMCTRHAHRIVVGDVLVLHDASIAYNDDAQAIVNVVPANVCVRCWLVFCSRRLVTVVVLILPLCN